MPENGAPSLPGRPDWLLVDGSSLIFRAFFGVPQTVVAPDGSPINAVRGFLDYLARFITERRPIHLAVATDEDWRPAFRVDAIPSYKTHRTAEPIPPPLEPQMPIIMEVLAAFGIAAVGAAGFEAEDVIASLVRFAEGRVEILSGDRDLFALVRDPDVAVLYPQSRGEVQVVDEAEIERKYGIPGRSYVDFAILRGDPSDGLPGLPNVGEKKAAALIHRHGSIEGVLWDGNLTEADVDYVQRAIKVVPPVATIPLERPDGRLRTDAADATRVAALKKRYGLGGAVDRLLRAIEAVA
jgi:5'-3' exonuclease